MGKHEMPDDVRAAIEDDGIDPETGEILEPRPDDDEPPEPDESDPENQPPPPPPLTPEKIEALWSALGRENERHAREVAKRAGPMIEDLVACPLCQPDGDTESVAGFIFPVLPEPAQSMRRFAIVEALGGMGEPEYPADPEAETCERCKGYGQTRTGSKAPGQETRPCPGCNGQGWKPKLSQQPQQTWTPPAPPAPAPFMPQPFGNGGGDPWGRPVGHPHYGQNPALIGA